MKVLITFPMLMDTARAPDCRTIRIIIHMGIGLPEEGRALTPKGGVKTEDIVWLVMVFL